MGILKSKPYVQQLRPSLENITYYHCDQLGTPQELTDRNAQLVWSANYQAWGEARIQLSAAGIAQDVHNQHRYQGHEQRPSTVRDEAQG